MKKVGVLACAALAAYACFADEAKFSKVEIDFASPAGRIKPMHAVNNAPLRIGRSLKEFKIAGIPYMRTHDTMGMWGWGHFIDVPNIFPNFDADENDPASYDFKFSDEFLKPVVASGCKVFYRLGVTIENYAHVKAYNIYPPKDFAKWARICEHIIMHYNEGWNKGFKWGIEYWEIWNECEGGAMWKGTREQFFELYRVAANHLKSKFPNIKIGGYGGCGVYSADDPENKVGSFGKGSKFPVKMLEWFKEFCRYVSAPETRAPLDFHSWHYYWNNEVMHYSRIQAQAKFVRETLDSFGLTKCESIMNEWNTRVNGYHGMKGQFGASFVADMFCLMQDSPIDMAMYYDAYPKRTYCGLFEPIEEATTPCYESFIAWDQLYRLGGAVAAKSGEVRLNVAAATDGKAKAFLLVNAYEREREVRPAVKGAGEGDRFTLYMLGGKNERLAAVGDWKPGEAIKLPSLGVAVAATDFAGPRQILIAGDSLLEERKGGTSYGSWGQQLNAWIKDDVVIDNLAKSGKSSKSFVSEGLWAKLLARIRKGDWVIVQFGHNDVAKDERRRTTVDEFRRNFERFADDVTARGGRPVFVSPTCCWDFDSKGKFSPRAYIRERADAMKAAALAKGAIFIDMTELTARELRETPKDDTRIDYMISRIGNADSMHTTRWGAKRFAELFVREVHESGSPFAEAFKTPAGMKPKIKVLPVN